MQVGIPILTVMHAIEVHRTTVELDEYSYADDGTPKSEEMAAETGAIEAHAFATFCTAPCLSPADVQAKIDYLLNERVGMRSTPLECLGQEEYGGWDMHEVLIRSLLLPATPAPTALAVAA